MLRPYTEKTTSPKSRLLEASADLDLFGEAGQNWAALWPDGGGYNHTVGFDAAKFARRQIHHHYDLPADQRLGFASVLVNWSRPLLKAAQFRPPSVDL